MNFYKTYLKFRYILFILLVSSFSLCLNSCDSLFRSKIITKNIQAGMTKSEVVQRIGYPFKKGFEEENGKYFDYWYYKESIYTLDSKYSLETVLVFYKDILLKIIPGKEERIYDKEPDARIIIRRE